jgi:hypothetical protein
MIPPQAFELSTVPVYSVDEVVPRPRFGRPFMRFDT